MSHQRSPVTTALWVILIVLVSVTVVSICFTALNMTGCLAWMKPGSKLAPFEERIDGPAAEMLRRSPELRANYEEFRTCHGNPDCYNSPSQPPLFAQRDQIIKKVWPNIFDRLVVSGDWGQNSGPRTAHSEFVQALADHGPDRLRNSCVPRLAYRQDNYADTWVESDGYVCDKPAPSAQTP